MCIQLSAARCGAAEVTVNRSECKPILPADVSLKLCVFYRWTLFYGAPAACLVPDVQSEDAENHHFKHMKVKHTTSHSTCVLRELNLLLPGWANFWTHGDAVKCRGRRDCKQETVWERRQPGWSWNNKQNTSLTTESKDEERLSQLPVWVIFDVGQEVDSLEMFLWEEKDGNMNN